MALIDMLCHYGVQEETLSLNVASAENAKTYADRLKLNALCFVSSEAALDLDGGAAHLNDWLEEDDRFYGWLTLSQHQLDTSMELARKYLNKPKWIGAAFLQETDADAIDSDSGIALLNSLRRYTCPVLLSVTSPRTLDAAVHVAKSVDRTRFIISPQSAHLTSNSLYAIRDILNLSLLPRAQFTERDVIAAAVKIIGPRRIYWGSDWGVYNPTAAMGMIKDSAVEAAERSQIIYRNAARLLK